MTEFVHLQLGADGLDCPVEALQLLFRLEDAGCIFRVDGDRFVVSGGPGVSEEDRATIRRYKAHLVTLVASCCP